MELGKGHEELGFSSPSPFLLDTGVCRQALWIGGRLPVRQLAACCPLLLAVPVAAQGWGALTGSVVGVDSVPLANARIQIAGTGPTVLSGRDGRFILTGVSPGIHVIEVQLLGYLRVLEPVEVGQGETVALHIVLTLAPVPLEGVAVEAEAGRLPAMRGFEGRRATGNGHYFNRAEIARMQPRLFTDVLRRVPGVQVQSITGPFGPSDVIRMARTTGISGARACPVLFYVNGTPFPVTGEISINQYIVPEDVVAVEVYSSASQVPSEFQSNLLNARCGVIVIWTRVGNETDTSPSRP